MKINAIILLISAALLFDSLTSHKVLKPNKLAKETPFGLEAEILAKILKTSPKKSSVPVSNPRAVDALVVKAIYSGIAHSISKALEITGRKFPKNLPQRNFQAKKVLKLTFEQLAREITQTVQSPRSGSCTIFRLMCRAGNKQGRRTKYKKWRRPKNPNRRHLSKTMDKLFVLSKAKRGNALQVLRSQMKSTYGQIGFSVNWLLFSNWAKSGDLNFKQIAYLRKIISQQYTRKNLIVIRNAGLGAFDRIISSTNSRSLKIFGCRIVKRAEKRGIEIRRD